MFRFRHTIVFYIAAMFICPVDNVLFAKIFDKVVLNEESDNNSRAIVLPIRVGTALSSRMKLPKYEHLYDTPRFNLASDVRDRDGNLIGSMGDPVTSQVDVTRRKSMGQNGKISLKFLHLIKNDGTSLRINTSFMVTSVIREGFVDRAFSEGRGNKNSVIAGTGVGAIAGTSIGATGVIGSLAGMAASLVSWYYRYGKKSTSLGKWGLLAFAATSVLGGIPIVVASIIRGKEAKVMPGAIFEAIIPSGS